MTYFVVVHEEGPAASRPGGVGRERARLPSLTSLRWFAASAVFLRHATTLVNGTPLAGFFHAVGAQGATGVSFFFMLSGFVLAWSFRPEDTRAAFWRRRVARIVPAYVVAAILGAAFTLQTGTARGPARVVEAIFPLSLLQSWVPVPAVYFGGDPLTWSLSTEVFFYLCFPFLIRPLVRLSRHGALALATVAGIVSITVPLVLRPRGDGTGLGFWAIYINPAFRLLEFVIGVCLCLLLVRGVRCRVPPLVATTLALGAYVAAGYVPLYAMWSVVTLVPFALVIASFAEADATGARSYLRHVGLIRLGQWSYAFYLLHWFVVKSVARMFGVPASSLRAVALLVASYVLATVAAYLLFRLVEHPLERRIRHGGSAMPRAELAEPLTSATPVQPA